jgi:hypothetical protein
MQASSPPQRPVPPAHDPPPAPAPPSPATPQPSPGEPAPGGEPAHDPPVYPEHNVDGRESAPHAAEILFDERVVPG